MAVSFACTRTCVEAATGWKCIPVRLHMFGFTSAVMKNVLRGALLAFMATFLGVFLFFTLPDWVAATAGRALPFWFYESEVRRFQS